jgi:hypothetical protein
MNCSSIWSLFQDVNYVWGTAIGIFVTIAATVIYIIAVYKNIDVEDLKQLILAALISAALVPFLLPKMIDRYFYLAELISIWLIFLN